MAIFIRKILEKEWMFWSSPKTMGTFFRHYTTTTKNKSNKMGKSYADQKLLLHYTQYTFASLRLIKPHAQIFFSHFC